MGIGLLYRISSLGYRGDRKCRTSYHRIHVQYKPCFYRTNTGCIWNIIYRRLYSFHHWTCHLYSSRISLFTSRNLIVGTLGSGNLFWSDGTYQRKPSPHERLQSKILRIQSFLHRMVYPSRTKFWARGNLCLSILWCC
ncbi:Uncharacterised protein [Chlamydia trachomatis]|nr:Uncharacterised protein [Chlamydia trachomatis]